MANKKQKCLKHYFLSLILLLCCFFVSSVIFADIIPLDTTALLQAVQKKDGLMAMRRVKSWLSLIQNNKNKTTMEKLTLVNNFFDFFPYEENQALVGQADYWMTPVEFLVKGGGICHDYAIAKYFTLRALGISDDHLQIVYVKALQLNQAHMVLAYYETPASDPLILDNLITQIKHGSERTDLLPVYSFNVENLWLAKQQGMGEKVGSSQQLSLWQDVLRRMNNLSQ